MNEVANGLLAHTDHSVTCGGMAGPTGDRFYTMAKLECVLILALLAGCASKPVINTQIIEKPVPVFCKVQMPEECKDLYAVDRVSVADAPLTINRAMRIEMEERAACEIKLRAALRGCNSKPSVSPH